MKHFNAKELNSGGMGIIVELFAPEYPDSVGKMIRPEYAQNSRLQEKFDCETEAALALSGHPNFPEVKAIIHDAHLSVKSFFGREKQEYPRKMIIMEHLGNMTLRDLINQMGKLDSGSIAKIAAELALALYTAHSHNIVHRDLKHDNVMLGNNGGGRVKVVDFGLSKDQKKHTSDTEGALIGSPSYMSPESYFCINNKKESDLFSLGIIILECLTRKRVFEICDYDIWLRRFGEIAYFNDYINHAHEIKYCSRHSAKFSQIEQVLEVKPEEKYALWRTQNPEEVRAKLQQHLDSALAISATVLPHKDQQQLQKHHGNLQKKDNAKPLGATNLQHLIDTQLSSITCDEELKTILTQLLNLDYSKRPPNEYILARQLAQIAVKYNPNLRLTEPFYTLIGRCTSISQTPAAAVTQPTTRTTEAHPPTTTESPIDKKTVLRKIKKLLKI